MSPLMMRYFTLVGIALAAAMQLKVRAETPSAPEARPALSIPAIARLN